MAPSSRPSVIQTYKSKVIEAVAPLNHSWGKLKDRSLPSLEQKNLDEFEPWEALTSRFARTTDIFLSKYFRLLVLDADPGFRGEMRNFWTKLKKCP